MRRRFTPWIEVQSVGLMIRRFLARGNEVPDILGIRSFDRVMYGI